MPDQNSPDVARLLADELRRHRGDTTLREVAQGVRTHHSVLWRYEQGLRIPPRDTVARLDALYEAKGELIRLREAAADLRNQARKGGKNHENGDYEDMERRRLIQAAAVGVGLTAMENHERVRQLLSLDQDDDSRSVEEWESTCEDLLHGLRVRPAARIQQAIGIELDALLRERQRASPARREDLLRIQAALAALYANALGRLSEHEAALRWWRTARRAADASKDQYLAIGIRATEAGNALYGQRSSGVVLELTRTAHGLAKGVPSWGLVYVLCGQARAATVLQRHDEALAALRKAEDLAGGAELPAPSVMPSYWNGGQATEWTSSMVYAGAGDEDRAARATGMVIANNWDYQHRAAARLHTALCTVANGGIKEGLTAATEIIGAAPPGHRTNVVTHTALIVLNAVPPEHKASPAAVELRATLGMDV
ncbi:helix-turn-helix domain-containing protein [Spongiactinospora sp. 9N601]|uniref:helix-turn-helix domain-containing protein n=1 Tax=Spongiactinospora sp. 9N601 TaxID=3375149 RepID=UPI0037B653D7